MTDHQWTDVYHHHVKEDRRGVVLEATDQITRKPGLFLISAAQIDTIHAEIHRNDQEAK